MNKILIILVLALFMSMTIAEEKIALELQKKMQNVRNAQLIPIVVLFEGMPTFSEVAQEYRFLGDEEVIREQVIREMKNKAESIHYWLQEMCNSRSMNNQVSEFKSIWIANAVAMNATPEAIREIAVQPNVEKVMLDEPVKMILDTREIAWGVERIGANKLWNYYNGTGVTVAVIDTGVNEHGDLAGRVIDGKNYIDATKPPRDDHAHGTHCAGTVAGDGAMGCQTGVAPKATIVAVKVLAANGSGAWSNLWLALEETVSNPNVKVLSMSLGGRPDETTRARLRLACNNAIAAGAIPVIAAGNSGPSAKTIGSPGDVPEIISIGATGADTANTIASFSSRGPATWDGKEIIRPDVSAPGVNVKSTRHDSNDYRLMSGTSMATPHVAGLVALMVQAKPGLVTAQAKEILEATATDLGTAGKDNIYGSGLVNAERAVTGARTLTQIDRSDRFEMVVKELAFETTVDANGNLDITETIENDLMPATVTIWADIPQVEARKGVYKVRYSLQGPNGNKEAVVTINFDNIPSDPNQYDSKYGFCCGNFPLVKGQYTGRVISVEPNAKVQNVKVTLKGKATWPARK